MRVFIDSNLPMYVAGREHPLRNPSRRFLARARAGELEACTSTEVLQEILYRYVGLRRKDLAQQVYDLFVELCPLVYPVTIADTDRAAKIISETDSGVRDAIHAAVMLNNDLRSIATWDQGFDRIKGIERIALD